MRADLDARPRLTLFAALGLALLLCLVTSLLADLDVVRSAGCQPSDISESCDDVVLARSALTDGLLVAVPTWVCMAMWVARRTLLRPVKMRLPRSSEVSDSDRWVMRCAVGGSAAVLLVVAMLTWG